MAKSSSQAERPTTKGEARKRKILEAAEEVFGREGYWGATTEEVATLAGVTQPRSTATSIRSANSSWPRSACASPR